MLPLARLFLAGCLTFVTSSLLAQNNQPAYSQAPMPSDREAEQQALARQYLAAPAGWASASDQPATPSPVGTYGTQTANLGSGRSSVAAYPESRAAFEPTAQPNRSYAPIDSPSADSRTSDFIPNPARLGLQDPVTTSRVQTSEPSELLPLPDVPASTVDTDALPSRVIQAAYLSEEPDKTTSSAPASDIPDTVEQNTATESEPSQPAPIPLEAAREPMPLTPPGATDSEGSRPTSGMPSMVTMVGGLGIVLGIFFVVAWGMRRATPGASMNLPNQVVEVLGRAPLAGRHQVHLLRCGNKLLLVSVTPDATETLTEITDPFEVDRLAGLCEQARPNSSSAAFRRAFQQFAHEEKGSYAS